MSEIIDATSYEFPGFFVIEALTQADDEVITDKLTGKGKDVEVTLLVNGVELPFTKTINNIYSRMQNQIEDEARVMAEKMVTEAGLESVAYALREVEWKVKYALANIKVKG